jgi:lipid-A-disaccharide synthase
MPRNTENYEIKKTWDNVLGMRATRSDDTILNGVFVPDKYIARVLPTGFAGIRNDAQFLLPLATRATRDAFENTMHRTGHDRLPLTLLYGHAEDALRAADVGIVASGTATLEAALARCPHVIYYRVSALTARIVLRRLLLPYVGLPNVLAGRFVVPEFIQDNATAANLAQAALNLFDDTVTRRRLEALFAGFAQTLSADTRAIAADAVAGELAQAGIAC